MADVSVRISFVTKQEQYRVTDAPIAVPAQLRRYGLSEIINHLLGRTEKPVPFDFLVNGELVRTTLGKFIEEHGLSTEKVTTVEYIQSVPPPQPKPDLPHDDWVAAVHANDSVVASGSYDGNVRIWDYAANCRAVLQGHTRPVRAVQLIKGGVLSAGDDESVKLWRVGDASDGGDAHIECNFVGHTAGVHALAVSPKADQFVTGGWDNTVRLWPTMPNLAGKHDASHAHVKTSSGKRSRVTAPAKAVVPSQHSIALFEGHTGPVTSLAWPSETQIFSGSWDHTIRQWDATSGLAKITMGAGRVVSGLAFSQQAQLLASAHEDRTVRLWDPRTQDGVVIKMRLQSHASWVSSVAWAPNSSFYLVSGSYDQSLKLWDIRSTTPLHTISAHSSKVLCVAWTEKALLSGGADNQLRMLEPPTSVLQSL